jgi:autotransporter-associated beta strand protein
MHLPNRLLHALLHRKAAKQARISQRVRGRQAVRPFVGSLEPRFVLNATAELNALGQLVISGDGANDTVQLDVDAQDRILIRDAANEIIPIAGHPGTTTHPLERSAITSNQLIVDLGGGDDVLRIDIPAGLNVQVLDSAGQDSTRVTFQQGPTPATDRVIDLASEQIEIDTSAGLVDLRSATIRLQGDVELGNPALATSLQMDDGSITVDGSFTLLGDVNLFGAGADLDLSQAELSSTNAGSDLRIAFDNDTDSDIALGRASDLRGHLVHNVFVDSADTLTIQADAFDIAGRLSISNVTDTVDVRSDVTALELAVNVDASVEIAGTITTEGLISIASSSDLVVTGQVDTSLTSNPSVSLRGGSLVLSDLSIRTSGGSVSLSGPIQLEGDLLVDSGRLQTANRGGEILVNGSVDSRTGVQSNIQLDSRGAVGRGAIILSDAVGDLSPLHSVSFLGNLVQFDSIQSLDGGVFVQAVGTVITGDEVTTTGDLNVMGALTWQDPSLRFFADDVVIQGEVSGQSDTQSLSVTASGNVEFGAGIVGFEDLTIVAGDTVTLVGSVNLSGALSVSGSHPTRILSASLETTGSQQYIGGVTFVESGFLDASGVILGSVTTVEGSRSYIINAPVVGSDLLKSGDGTLILADVNAYTGSTTIEAGSLRINGSTALGAGPVFVTGGSLEGSGIIRSEVIAGDGAVIDPGPRIASLNVAGLSLDAGTTLRFDIGGTIEGQQYDRIVVDGIDEAGLVQLGLAQLELTFDGPAEVATEYILIRNDGVDAVTGQFTSTTASDGTVLTTPRVLNEGDLVSLDFGQSRRPAYITYAGGDGNDVAIVTAGDLVITAGDVTLVQRRGSNLEVRTGTDPFAAQLASPVIRPIAAINDYQLSVIGSDADQSLVIDLDRFVDRSADPIQFVGDVRFIGGGPNDNDSVSFVDLDMSSNDSPLSFRYEINQADAGNIEVLTEQNGTQFNVLFDQLESIVQSVFAPVVEFQYSELSEQIEIRSLASDAEQTSFLSSPSAGGELSVVIRNPSDRLVVQTGAGDDSITIDSESSLFGFNGALQLDGQAGSDVIDIRTALALGNDSVTGNLELAAETITASRDINTSFGDVDGEVKLTGGTLIRLTDDAIVNAGHASITLHASGGMVDLSEGTIRTQNLDTAFLIGNASNVNLGDVDVALGQLRMTTVQGPGNIVQAPESEVIADRLSIDSFGDVLLDSPVNQFRLIEQIVANGEISIHDNAGGVDVIRVDSNGNDVTLFADDTIQLAAGAIIAERATVRLTATAGVFSTSTSTEADIRTANVAAGSINMTVLDGNIGTSSRSVVVAAHDAFNSELMTQGAEVYLSSPTVPLPIGLISAPEGKVVIDAISIQDATDDDQVDIVTEELMLNAIDGIGSLRRLEIRDVIQLTAVTTSGGIDIDHFSVSNLEILLLKTATGDIKFTHTDSQQVTVSRVEGGSGDMSIINENGSLVINGLLQTTSGDVSLSAGSDITFESQGHLQTQSGPVIIVADLVPGNPSVGILMRDGSIVETISGRVTLVSDGDITLGSVRSASTDDNAISIQSTSGKIIDGGDTHVDLIADSGGVQIVSRRGIGDGGELETTIGRLTAEVIDSGAVVINESTDLELLSVITADGAIMIQSAGEMVVKKVVSFNEKRVDDEIPTDGNSRDIRLTTTGSASDILVGKITANHGSDVQLVAGDDVLHLNRDRSGLIIADSLGITASNGTADNEMSIDLNTEVNNLVFTVNGINIGDVLIVEKDSINLASSDHGGDKDQLFAGNGRITIHAMDSIFVNDSDATNDTDPLRGDPEIIAGGDRGQVAFTAGNRIELAGATQIKTSLSSFESIFISAPTVVLGDQIQLTTGDGVGIARWFSPRPVVGVSETAFFDFTTVQTNRLEQANANDAQGILSLLIGRPGEMGFTINIDWGDSNDPKYRFQQIDNLPGFETFSQSHVYFEGDILDSRLNGRTSGTEPLQVRFSVRHHESIFVQGDTIQQASAEAEIVEGRRISSTDNPLTEPLLEVGTASFRIPNLTIPVAFFPVRQIIPEVEEQEIFVRVESTPFFVSGTLESKSASVSSTISREEYFQIRVLSLEPGGDDLIKPQRLPDDILSGDNLKTLFEDLPDGKYEIQYVLGDGNERMLLRFDLRNHQPVVPGDDPDESELRLEVIDPESILQELQDSLDDVDSSEAMNSDQAKFDRFSVAGRFISRRRDLP